MLDEGRVVVARDGGLACSERPLDAVGDRRVAVLDGLEGAQLEYPPDAVDVDDVLGFELRHDRAAMELVGDQSVCHEHPDGVANRVARDREGLGERRLAQALSLGQAPVGDHLAQRLRNLVDRAHTLEGEVLSVQHGQSLTRQSAT